MRLSAISEQTGRLLHRQPVEHWIDLGFVDGLPEIQHARSKVGIAFSEIQQSSLFRLRLRVGGRLHVIEQLHGETDISITHKLPAGGIRFL